VRGLILDHEVGLISFPGTMTGLILAGVDLLTAIRYQIVAEY
jgi:putative ABC transport system permease protein